MYIYFLCVYICVYMYFLCVYIFLCVYATYNIYVCVYFPCVCVCVFLVCVCLCHSALQSSVSTLFEVSSVVHYCRLQAGCQLPGTLQSLSPISLQGCWADRRCWWGGLFTDCVDLSSSSHICPSAVSTKPSSQPSSYHFSNCSSPIDMVIHYLTSELPIKTPASKRALITDHLSQSATIQASDRRWGWGTL